MPPLRSRGGLEALSVRVGRGRKLPQICDRNEKWQRRKMKEKCDGLLCMSKNSSNFAAHFRSVVNETESKRTSREETDIYKETIYIYTGNK